MTEKRIGSMLNIGELARECDVSADTLRHYERMEVLPPAERRANGYRCYDRRLVPRVRLVRQALAIGFTLEELAAILKVRDRGGTPCRRVRALAGEKLAEPAKSSMKDCPMMTPEHAGAVDARGDQGMGFSHETTTHHFRIFRDGGAIEVTANDPQDATSRDQIRMHLRHIATLFGQGDFKVPMFVHDQMPDGAATMQDMKEKISYRYEETKKGGKVRMTTADPKALAAIHEFMRFQIREHRTGDREGVTG